MIESFVGEALLQKFVIRTHSDLTDLDAKELRASRASLRIEIDDDLPPQDGLIATLVIRAVRECARQSVPISWNLPQQPLFNRQLLGYLPRPRNVGSDILEIWPDAVPSYGQLYFRNGPGFTLIRDSRPQRLPMRLTLDDDVSISTFNALGMPLRLEALSSEQLGVLDELVNEGVVLVAGSYAVALPYEMTQWPVPFNGI